MAKIQRLGDIFINTVARNRSLTFQQVRNTQATTFHGEEAIKAGFADKIDTFEQLLASLNASMQTSRDGNSALQQQGAILKPTATARKGQSAPSATQVSHIYEAQVRSACAAAKLPEADEHYIAARIDIKDVRAELAAMLAAGEVGILPATPGDRPSSNPIDELAENIYDIRSKKEERKVAT